MLSLNKDSSFQKDALILSIGTIISQAIPVFSMLIFSRYYSDASLGTFNLFFQIVSVLSSVANGRLEQAYFVMENPKDARDVFFTALSFNVIFSVVLLTVSFLGLNFPQISPVQYDIVRYSYFIPISIFLGGIILASNFYLNYQGNFRLLSGLRIFQALVANLIPMIFLLFYFNNATGLIIGFVVGQFAILAGYLWSIKKSFFHGFQLSSKEAVLATLVKYKVLPSVNSPLILVDQLAASLPIIFIYAYYSDSIAGQFSLASRLLLLPAVVVGNAMGQVFYKKLSDLRKIPVEAFILFKDILKKLIIFSLFFFTTTFLLSKPVFPLLFGHGWETAGYIASYLSISMVFKFIVSPLSSVLLVFGKYKMLGLWQMCNFALQFIIIFFSYWFKFEFFNYIWILIIVDLASYLIYFWIIYKVISNFRLNVDAKI